MKESAAHPIQTLREHATALEAAVSVCLADPSKKAVHRIRTETRRIEAQLALLEQLPDLPSHAEEAGKVQKYLKKLRRAAGEVRDLDVQRKLIKEQIEQADGDKKLEREGKKMRKRRKRMRQRAAGDLLHILEKRGPKLSGALEDLLSAFGSQEDFELGTADLLKAVDRQFASQPSLGLEDPSDDELHDIRKAAKIARYQAETLNDSKAEASAKRYEALQDRGGTWHDWLQLAADAADELGESHEATAQFSELRDKHLEDFRAGLEELRQSPGQQRKPARRSRAAA